MTDQEKLRAQQIIRTLSVDHDEVRGITWYKPKFTDDLGNQIYLYVGKRSDKPPILRLSIRYYDDDWLFVRSYTIKADDKTFELVPDDPPEHDNAGGKVWEWSDELATPHMNMLDAIIKSRKTILRYNGSKYYHDEIVSDTQRQWLDAMILVNRYLAAN